MDRDCILVAGDDDGFTETLSLELRLDGYETLTAHAPDQVVLMATGHTPAALILGDMPGLAQSLALARELRDESGVLPGVDPLMPMIILSATAGELCEVRALEAGADDFQPAGCPHPVLRARLAGLLRRSRQVRAPERLRIADLLLDLTAREAHYAGRPLGLHRKEFALLARLAAEPTRAFTADELLRDVWGHDCVTYTRTVSQTACRVRRKLAAAGAADHIAYRCGGYRLLPFGTTATA